MSVHFKNSMKFIISLLILSVNFSFGMVPPGPLVDTIESRPNIVFILADDLGWMDLGVQGSKYYDTPNIDRLASRGVRFTNAYSPNPLCTPSRASILTGKFPERFHITVPAGHLTPNPAENLLKKEAPAWQKVVTPESRTFLPLEATTIAEVLKDAGYATGFIGKWHLGQNPYSPENQGFDYNVAGGPNPGPPNYFPPYGLYNLTDGPPHEYIQDRIGDEAVKYIKNHKDSTFFLCYWLFGVHAPFQGKLSYVEQYKNKKDPRGKQDNPIMAAMIKSLDDNVGKVLNKIDELNLSKNTIVIFYSDNGGNMYDVINGKDATNNAPLRAGKGNIYEGGIRVPLIFSWPGKIPEGKVNQNLVSNVDFFPTLITAAGIDTNTTVPSDGKNLWPTLLNSSKIDRESLYFFFPHYVVATNNYPAAAVRYKNWKLIRFYGEGKDRTNSFELYDLNLDIGETNNLASKHQDLVKYLDGLITEHIREVNALEPIKNPAYQPSAINPLGKRPIFPTEKYIMY